MLIKLNITLVTYLVCLYKKKVNNYKSLTAKNIQTTKTRVTALQLHGHEINYMEKYPIMVKSVCNS